MSITTLYLFGFKENSKIELSVKDAFSLGLSAAKQWDSTAQLVLFTSVDESKSGTHGIKGKRRDWNMIFKSDLKKQAIIISIRDGKLTEKNIFENEEDYNYMNIDELKIDSSEQLVKKAINKHNLKPGNGFLHGIHFTLQKSDDNFFLTIVGNDNEGKIKEVHFNALNGDYLGETQTN